LRFKAQEVQKISRFAKTDASLSRRKIRNLPRRSRDDFSLNWADGDCVGYTVNPRLYAGKPPKGSTDKISHQRMRRKDRNALKQKVKAHALFISDADLAYKEFSRKIDDFTSEFIKREPLIEIDDEVRADMLMIDKLKQPATLERYAETVRRLLPPPIPTEWRRGMGKRPYLTDDRVPTFQFLQTGVRKVWAFPIEYIHQTVFGVQVNVVIPSDKYPKNKKIRNLILPAKLREDKYEQMDRIWRRTLQPFYSTDLATRAQAYAELSDNYLSKKTDYGIPQGGFKTASDADKHRIQKI
jgi:hypothetical protein